MKIIVIIALTLVVAWRIALWLWVLLYAKKRRGSKAFLLFAVLKAASLPLLILGFVGMAVALNSGSPVLAAVGWGLLALSILVILGHALLFWWVRSELFRLAEQATESLNTQQESQQ